MPPFAILLALALGVDPAADPAAAARDPDFLLQGEYTAAGVGVQVVAQGKGEFLLVNYPGGLPGAGWTGQGRQENDLDAAEVKAAIAKRGLVKVERKSPTLGAKPPAGAVVLFDGPASLDKWQKGAKAEGDLLMQGANTVAAFGDFLLHVEFRLPYMPAARGQGRGNSGVYCQGRYETQVLDSFGLAGKNNECGGIYTIKAPDVNMCLPPLAWQTYDIEFTAARWKDGKKSADARITVRHNGVPIHRDAALPKTTTAAPVKLGPEPGILHLQDHGNPVRYRNLWLVPRDAEREAKRPKIAAFERFHGAGEDPVAGGKALLAELNCAACHKQDGGFGAEHPRPAPNLEGVAARVRKEWLAGYLADPHAAKPGGAMPDVLRSLPAEERPQAAADLAAFLGAGRGPASAAYDKAADRRGERLYAEIGCVACHGPRAGEAAGAAVLPLGKLGEKYTIASLAKFLEKPHDARPSGRMPRLVQDGKEALDLAMHLVGPQAGGAEAPNWRWTAHRGNWQKLPDFDALKDGKQGTCAGLNLAVVRRGGGFAVRYDGFLELPSAGTWTFHLGSDDGSRLFIDGAKVLDVDGIHPHDAKTAKAELHKGTHAIRVEYFQGAGEASLELEIEKPGVPRQPIDAFVQLDRTPAEAKKPAPADAPAAPALTGSAARGKERFGTLGCANCHALQDGGKALASTLAVPKVAKLDGCIAGSAAAPGFDLSPLQQAALRAALSAPMVKRGPFTPAETIDANLTRFNCYACHARGGKGGPEYGLDKLFVGTTLEMGDEGRLPPALDGVGDKLRPEFLKSVVHDGIKDRPYMKTRMPRFASAAPHGLAAALEAFVKADRQPTPLPNPGGDALENKAAGRHLTGDQAFGCVKCHVFGQRKLSGLQALDLQRMNDRLNPDWLARYLVDPPKYRPGTKMPTSFPGGVSAAKSVLGGDRDRQLAALLAFLAEGRKAATPDGLGGQALELKPAERPILYRGFFEECSERTIAVGLPAGVHYLWDTKALRPAILWRGKFLDVAKQWEGRGEGNIRPLGDFIVAAAAGKLIVEGPPLKFLGYALDAGGNPTFRYGNGVVTVEETLQPLPGSRPGLRRELRLAAKGAAPAFKIDAPGTADAQGWRTEGSVKRRWQGQAEWQAGAAALVEEFSW